MTDKQGGQTERASRHTDRQTDRRQTYKQSYRQTCRQTDQQPTSQASSQSGGEDEHTARTDAGRQTNKETNRPNTYRIRSFLRSTRLRGQRVGSDPVTDNAAGYIIRHPRQLAWHIPYTCAWPWLHALTSLIHRRLCCHQPCKRRCLAMRVTRLATQGGSHRLIS